MSQVESASGRPTSTVVNLSPRPRPITYSVSFCDGYLDDARSPLMSDSREELIESDQLEENQDENVRHQSYCSSLPASSPLFSRYSR